METDLRRLDLRASVTSVYIKAPARKLYSLASATGELRFSSYIPCIPNLIRCTSALADTVLGTAPSTLKRFAISQMYSSWLMVSVPPVLFKFMPIMYFGVPMLLKAKLSLISASKLDAYLVLFVERRR